MSDRFIIEEPTAAYIAAQHCIKNAMSLLSMYDWSQVNDPRWEENESMGQCYTLYGALYYAAKGNYSLVSYACRLLLPMINVFLKEYDYDFQSLPPGIYDENGYGEDYAVTAVTVFNDLATMSKSIILDTMSQAVSRCTRN